MLLSPNPGVSNGIFAAFSVVKSADHRSSNRPMHCAEQTTKFWSYIIYIDTYNFIQCISYTHMYNHMNDLYVVASL